jgi:hypothetical protein
VRFTSMAHSAAMRASRVAAGWLVAVVVAVARADGRRSAPRRSGRRWLSGGFAVAQRRQPGDSTRSSEAGVGCRSAPLTTSTGLLAQAPAVQGRRGPTHVGRTVELVR